MATRVHVMTIKPAGKYRFMSGIVSLCRMYKLYLLWIKNKSPNGNGMRSAINTQSLTLIRCFLNASNLRDFIMFIKNHIKCEVWYMQHNLNT